MSAPGASSIAAAPPIRLNDVSNTSSDGLPDGPVGNRDGMARVAWWKFRAPRTMLVDFSLKGSTAPDTRVGIYRSDVSDPSSMADLELWWADDDTYGWTAVATGVEIYAGETYWINVGQYDDLDNTYVLTVKAADADLTPVQPPMSPQGPRYWFGGSIANRYDNSLFITYITISSGGAARSSATAGVWVGRRVGDELVTLGTYFATSADSSPYADAFVTDLQWLDATTFMFRPSPTADPDPLDKKLVLGHIQENGTVTFSAPVLAGPTDRRELSPAGVIGNKTAKLLYANDDENIGVARRLHEISFDFDSGSPANVQTRDLGHTVVDPSLSTWGDVRTEGCRALPDGNYLVYGSQRPDGSNGGRVYVLRADGTTGPQVDLGILWDDAADLGSIPDAGNSWVVTPPDSYYGEVFGTDYWINGIEWTADATEAIWMRFSLLTGTVDVVHTGAFGGDWSNSYVEGIYSGQAYRLNDTQMWALYQAANSPPGGSAYFTYNQWVCIDVETLETVVHKVTGAMDSGRFEGIPAGDMQHPRALTSGWTFKADTQNQSYYFFPANPPGIQGELKEVRRVFARP